MQKNLPLIVGIALPIVFIVILIVAIALPPMFINPKHDFLYTMGTNYYNNVVYSNVYQVVNGKLTLKPVVVNATNPPARVMQDAPPLYQYKVKSNTAHEISLEDAQKLILDAGPSSPEGYTVGYKYGNGDMFDLFGGNNNSYGFYISNGSSGKRLTGINSRDSYNFALIGWVK